MKKVLTVLSILLIAASLANAQKLLPTFALKAGYEMPGTLTATLDDNDNDNDVKSGFSFSGELTANLLLLDVGVGASYMAGRELDIEDFNGSFGFTPIYAIVKFTVLPLPLISPKLIAHGGLSLFNPDDDFKASMTPGFLAGTIEVEGENGYYLGIGAGVEVRNLSAELMYKFNSAGMKYSVADQETTVDFLYSYVSLSVSYGF